VPQELPTEDKLVSSWSGSGSWVLERVGEHCTICFQFPGDNDPLFLFLVA